MNIHKSLGNVWINIGPVASPSVSRKGKIVAKEKKTF